MKFQLTIISSGILCGIGLATSGMADPSRVIDFLNIFGAWDPSLIAVMGAALSTYAIGLLLWKKVNKGKGLFGCTLPAVDADPIDKRLILGSATFGVGWGLAGFCPGPAIASLTTLRYEAWIFVPAMLIGMLIAQRLFKADQ